MEPSKSNTRKAIRLPKGLLFASIAGGIYYLLIQFTPLRIPCFFRTVTGLQCPGCGVTHMILALLHLDFPTAFHASSTVLPALSVGRRLSCLFADPCTLSHPERLAVPHTDL